MSEPTTGVPAYGTPEPAAGGPYTVVGLMPGARRWAAIVPDAEDARAAEDAAREENPGLWVVGVLIADGGVARPVDDAYAVFVDPDVPAPAGE